MEVARIVDPGKPHKLAFIGVRANIHWGGGGRPSFARMDSVGGVSEIFRDPYSLGGGVVAEIFPGSTFCGVAEFFPLMQ